MKGHKCLFPSMVRTWWLQICMLKQDRDILIYTAWARGLHHHRVFPLSLVAVASLFDLALGTAAMHNSCSPDRCEPTSFCLPAPVWQISLSVAASLGAAMIMHFSSLQATLCKWLGANTSSHHYCVILRVQSSLLFSLWLLRSVDYALKVAGGKLFQSPLLCVQNSLLFSLWLLRSVDYALKVAGGKLFQSPLLCVQSSSPVTLWPALAALLPPCASAWESVRDVFSRFLMICVRWFQMVLDDCD